MKSTKVLTINPIPSGVNQKLVPAKKYNELWEDVYRLDLRSYQPSIIGDKGLGDNVIAISATNIFLSLIGTQLSAYGKISLSDMLTFVHYTGTRPLTYYIKFTADPLWTSSQDISEAVLDLDQNYVGAQSIDVKVGDGMIESLPLTITVTVANPPV